MTLRFSVIVAAVLFAAFLLAGCGGGGSKSDSSSGSPTTAFGSSDVETSAVTGDTTDPKNDAYACALISKGDIDAATGSASQAGTHKKATVLQGEALTSCTVKSAVECPSSCDKAYQAEWSVDIYPSANAAQLTFGNDKRGGTNTPVTIAGADEAVYYSTTGAVEVRKGAGLLRLTYNGPGTLSGSASTPAKVAPEDEAPAEAMVATMTKKLP